MFFKIIGGVLVLTFIIAVVAGVYELFRYFFPKKNKGVGGEP